MKAIFMKKMKTSRGVISLLSALLSCALLTQCDADSSSSHVTALGCIHDNDDVISCFYHYNVTQPWAEAQAACALDGRQLAALADPRKDADVHEFLRGHAGRLDVESPGVRCWVGGHASNDTRWTWLNGANFNDSKNASMSFGTEPKKYQSCGSVVVPSLTANDTSINEMGRHCRSALHFICQANMTEAHLISGSTCHIGVHKGVVNGNQCFVVYGNDPDSYRQTFMKANKSCDSIGAQLAAFDSMGLADIAAVLNAVPGVYWIGLTNQKWIWVDEYESDDSLSGPPVGYTNWYSDPTVVLETMECMAAGVYPPDKYGWTGEPCGQPLTFVCEETIVLTTTAPPTTSTHHYGNKTDVVVDDNETHLRDWANVIIPCAMIALIALAAILSVTCYYRQKRDKYIPK